jgi:D-3-phosphoglycerate dehydrogenase
MRSETTYIIDFDSTFTKVEALDELVRIVLQNDPSASDIEKRMTDLTNQAMNGELEFHEALTKRLSLLHIHRSHIDQLIAHLLTCISDSFLENINRLRAMSNQILIVSGGFREFILPVVATFGIKPEQVYANSFFWNEQGMVIGFDPTNPLSKSGGKVRLVSSLHLKNEVIIIGDGYTDFEIREAGFASAFYLFTENISRTKLIDKADRIINRIDSILS